MVKIFTSTLIIFILVGCTSQNTVNTKVKMNEYDKNTMYHADYHADSFTVSVLYTRYQFIPESSALTTACKNQLTSIAWEIAELNNKEIKPVNEQRIKISTGRNGFIGLTECGATATVYWNNN